MTETAPCSPEFGDVILTGRVCSTFSDPSHGIWRCACGVSFNSTHAEVPVNFEIHRERVAQSREAK